MIWEIWSMNHRTFLGEPPYAHRGGFVEILISENKSWRMFSKSRVSDGKRKSVSFGLRYTAHPAEGEI